MVENNHFGTHEFLDRCEQLGAEPCISGNVGSGTVQEMMEWVEYMTSAADSTMANLRRQNGRQEPWKLRCFGGGNESWGCGGNMWHEVELGTNPGFRYQQNSLRDALVAGLTFHIFHRHADRVRMANIAQPVNVPQSMILTDRAKHRAAYTKNRR